MPSYQAANEKIPVEADPARTTNQPVGTLANLKTAAAGLHVRIRVSYLLLWPETNQTIPRALAKLSAEH